MIKQTKKNIVTIVGLNKFDESIVKSTENLSEVEGWLMDLGDTDYINECIDLVCEEMESRQKAPAKKTIKTPAKKETKKVTTPSVKKTPVKKEEEKEEVKNEVKAPAKSITKKAGAKNDPLKVNDIREEFKAGLKGEIFIKELDTYFNFKIANKKVQDVQTYLVSGKITQKIAKLRTSEAYTIDLFGDDRRKKLYTMVVCDFDLNKKSFRYADEESGEEFHCKVTEYYV